VIIDNNPSTNTSTANAPPTPIKEVTELENTGERFLPGATNSAEIAYDHLTRYRLAERYVSGKSAIDLGCGAGYGTYSLAKVARRILGVDLSMEAIFHAAERYQAPNLRYEVGNVVSLPYEDESFQVAVSFEVIEHLEHPEALLLEAKRLLKKDGVFVVSTPNKQTYSNNRNRVNLYHLKEMYPLELQEVLERYFEYVQIYWQGSLAGSVITPDPKALPEDGQATLESAQFSLPDPVFDDRFPTTLYMVAVCTNGKPPEPLHRPFLVLDCDRQIYEEYEDQQYSLWHLQMHHEYMLIRQRQEANKRLREAHKMLQEAHKMLQEERKRFRQPIERLQEVSERLQNKEQQLLQVSERLHEMNQQLQDVRKRLRRVSGEIAHMQSTLRWKIAYSINVLYRKIVPPRRHIDNEQG
jgi:SAM-dependent methyltransferase/uncharacterized protein YoxC